MSMRDLLRIDLPAASLRTDENVETRGYPCTIFCNSKARFIKLVIESISYTPANAKVEIWNESAGEEFGRFTGANGSFPLQIEINEWSSLILRLFNWSLDTPASLTFIFTGYQYGELGA